MYTTIFIVNLAAADFLYCVTSLPMYAATVRMVLSRHSKHWGCLLLLLVCTTYPAYRTAVHTARLGGRLDLRWLRHPPLHQRLRRLDGAGLRRLQQVHHHKFLIKSINYTYCPDV